MVSSSKALRGAMRFVVPALFAIPAVASAQMSGDGFLFGRPAGSLTVRGGYELQSTSGQPFQILQKETTVGPRSFDALNAAADLNFVVSPYVDVSFTGEAASRSKSAEYRDWEENGQAIVQQSVLERYTVGGGLRFNLTPRGRQISTLAWIPTRTVPYVGLNYGVLWYRFRQQGDFVEVSPTDSLSASIFTDNLKSGSQGRMGQVYAGIDRRLNARWSVVGEARYTQASAKLTDDYEGLGNGNIQLSGLALNVGVAVRY